MPQHGRGASHEDAHARRHRGRGFDVGPDTASWTDIALMVMRFGRLDLNLLVALHALLEERSVTRASVRLNMSQPAMSSALAKLREYFADELLVRCGREMVPTAQAAFLVGPVTAVLTAVQHATTTRPTFDPGSAERTFHLMMSDYVASVLLPPLLQILPTEAPNIHIQVEASDASMSTRLERREIDLAIVPDKFIDPEHPAEEIMQDGYVVVVDRGNRTIGDEISLDEYVSAEHVVTNLAGSRQASFEDWFLENFDVSRKATITVPTFSLIPALVSNTNLIGTMHSRLAISLSKHYNIRLVKLPDNFPKIREWAQWHRLSDQDLGLKWLLSKIHAIGQQTAS
jgi:DNA-binding transcriptional LysR family regulator